MSYDDEDIKRAKAFAETLKKEVKDDEKDTDYFGAFYQLKGYITSMDRDEVPE